MPPSTSRHHTEWLSLVEVSGPFLSLPVLLRVFPQGLDAHDPDLFRDLRAAYEEWEDNQTGRRADPSVHRQWIRFVLGQVLELPDEVLAEGQAIPQTLKATVAEHGETLRPDIVVVNPQGGTDPGKPRLLVQTYPLAQGLDSPVAGRHWKASPATRMMELLHATDIRLGLVTSGEHWMLVDAPRGETTGFASWYAHLWLDEQVTLRAFRSLLRAHRFFSVAPTDTLEAMLAESAENQQEVTDQLGYQVRRAVEVLVQHLDRADQDHGRELLADVPETVLYEAALTVMMRLVFLFCAEERGLLLLGDPLYDQHYAVSTLREQLREAADQHGEEVLERRLDAWCRLLATFRAVFAGVEHDRMRLLAYGGRLFDPDRFPFLEGRAPHTSWRTHAASPLPVNNRTVLHLLESLQLLEVRLPGGGPVESRRLSFRALDIEQIGHVYEGLLDHTAVRAEEPVLGLAGTKDKEPEIPLSELEAQLRRGEDEFVKYLHRQTGRSESALRKALQPSLEAPSQGRLQAACGNDPALYQRVQLFAGLIRNDTFGYPVVIPKGSVYVTSGTDRRTSGTHYTPRSLTEPIVQYTLEPLVYVGPAEGRPKEEWQLRPASGLLDLRICDMACGSGAFLVQACRYMSERLAEAWEDAERQVAGNDTATAREATRDGSQALPGAGRLAVGDGPGGGVLQGDQRLPEGGALRLDQPDPESSRLDPGEHRGGAGPSAHEGVPQPPEHGPGLPDGTGDSSAAQRTDRPVAGGDAVVSYGSDGRDQPDALRSSELSPEASVGRSLATRHSPLITPFGLPATGAPGETIIPSDPNERLAFARRLVAQRCLYGVDINPLAVEMAKLSLWLLTLAKDKPFTFLDHAIRCGDSLVGLREIDELKAFRLGGGEESKSLAGALHMLHLDAIVSESARLRSAIAATPATDVESLERQQHLLAEYEKLAASLKAAADLLIAAEMGLGFEGRRGDRLAAASLKASALMQDLHADGLRAAADEALGGEGRVAGGENATRPVRSVPGSRLPATSGSLATRHSPLVTPFHWPLEFPEIVVSRGGFDALVCNPPFMGGQKITGNLGTPYREYLVHRLASGARGSADLCAYFFLRAASLLREGGQFGFLATNTIAQGDTREVGLDQLTARGYTIPRAVPSRKWPGSATVEVAHVYVRRGPWPGPFVLDEQPVAAISPYLTVPGAVQGKPHRLAANADMSFIGSYVLGMGFVLTPEEAERLIEKDPRNLDVLFPYLNGEDLNSRPDQSASRWVINFFDWPLNRDTAPEGYDGPVAADYPDCLAIVEEKVKPQRLTQNDRFGQEYWWRFLRTRPELHAAIAGLERVLVTARVSKHHCFVLCPTGLVPSEQTVVVASDSGGLYAVLQSAAHEAWTLAYQSSLETRSRYTPSDCFETFPFPSLATHHSPLAPLGERYHEHRRQVMLDRREGLTKTYNRFHDPQESAADIVRLRELHVEMDYAVAAAYGWTDLELGHGFHETRQGVRYTISDPARQEVLSRLLQLNHERYAEEVKQGLHGKGKGKAKGGGRKAEGKMADDHPTLGVLGDE